jgi:hypothetical protein
MKRITLNRLLCAFLASGLLFLLVEVWIEHYEKLREEPFTWIPLVAGLIGLPLCTVTAWRWSPALIRATQAFCLALLLVGVGGVFFHNEERFEGVEIGLTDRAWADGDDEGRGGIRGERGEKEPPPLAPFSFAGMGVLGLLATLRRWPAEVVG